MREITNDPPVFSINQIDEKPVEEEADNDDAGAVVPTALHDWVHVFSRCY